MPMTFDEEVQALVGLGRQQLDVGQMREIEGIGQWGSRVTSTLEVTYTPRKTEARRRSIKPQDLHGIVRTFSRSS